MAGPAEFGEQDSVLYRAILLRSTSCDTTTQQREPTGARGAPGRSKQTAPRSAPQGMTVTVVNPIHPLNGHVLLVQRVTCFAGVRVVVVEHPEGGTLTLPESVLGLTPGRPVMAPGCLFDVARLVVALGRVAQLKDRT